MRELACVMPAFRLEGAVPRPCPPIRAWAAGSAPDDMRALVGVTDVYGWIAFVPKGMDVPAWTEPASGDLGGDGARADDAGGQPVTAPEGDVVVWFDRDGLSLPPAGGGCVQTWEFWSAPPEILALPGAFRGGDEDWIAILPPGWEVPAWMERPGFARCGIESTRQPDGRLLVVATHA